MALAKTLVRKLVLEYKLRGYKYIRTRWIYKKLFPLVNKKEITDTMRELEREGILKREKKGLYVFLD